MQNVKAFAYGDPMVGEVPMPDTRKLDILLLCDYRHSGAGTVIDHIMSIEKFSHHRIWILSNLGSLPARLDLDRFDGIVLHYSLVISSNNFLSSDARSWIRRFEGFKAVYVQDDYRWIDRTVAAFRYLRINAVFGLVSQNIIDQVYSPVKLPGVRRETVLAGYVPEELTQVPVNPYGDRRLDVGYRARRLPAWIGEHAQEKWRIAERFSADAKNYGIVVDISCREEDRIYGRSWIDFLSDCKAVLGSESGSSVCDFSGEIQANVERHERENPDTPFEVLRDLYFKDLDGKITISVISPRCFEAAALRTLMILYEGDYFGILKPWRHYVPLKKDHSNMDEVVAALRDPQRAQQIIDTAYHEVALNPQYSYKAMVEQFDRVLGEEFRPEMRRSKRAYRPRSFAKIRKRAASPLRWPNLKLHVLLLGQRVIIWIVNKIVPSAKRDSVRLWLKRRYHGLRNAVHRAHGSLKMALGVFKVLWYIRPGTSVKLALAARENWQYRPRLVFELLRLTALREFVLRSDAIDVVIIWDDEAGRLSIEGRVPDQLDLPDGPDFQIDELEKALAAGTVREILWVNKDYWALAPKPPLGDKLAFRALAKAGSACPELVTGFLKENRRRQWIKRFIRVETPLSASLAGTG